MTTQELDRLWELYREFCYSCNHPNMTESAPEFLAWIERFRMTETKTEIHKV